MKSHRLLESTSVSWLCLSVWVLLICFCVVSLPTGASNQSYIAIGFLNKHNEMIWTFFTSFTLALLTAFQVIIFCLVFLRLIQAILNQKRFESNEEEDKAHLVRGTGWISAATKLGAVETMIGFAGGGFGVALTRRILRLLGRACLCIGTVKGYVIYFSSGP